MIGFLAFIMEVLVASGIALALIFFEELSKLAPGGNIFIICLIVGFAITELLLIFHRTKKNVDKVVYETEKNSEEGNGAVGFFIGFSFGLIGYIVSCFSAKPKTKKGALVGMFFSILIQIVVIATIFINNPNVDDLLSMFSYSY